MDLRSFVQRSSLEALRLLWVIEKSNCFERQVLKIQTRMNNRKQKKSKV